MTRSWTFTLPNVGVWLNLWNDLIALDSTFTDQFFGNSQYVPSMVTQLEIRNQTGGATLQRANDNKKEAGILITGSVTDSIVASRNSIDLKQIYLQTDTKATVVYVGITSS